jgi:hypothetical protein
MQISEKVLPTLDGPDRERAAATCFEALGRLKDVSLEWTTEILTLVESLAGSQKVTRGCIGVDETLGVLLARCGTLIFFLYLSLIFERGLCQKAGDEVVYRN